MNTSSFDRADYLATAESRRDVLDDALTRRLMQFFVRSAKTTIPAFQRCLASPKPWG